MCILRDAMRSKRPDRDFVYDFTTAVKPVEKVGRNGKMIEIQ